MYYRRIPNALYNLSGRLPDSKIVEFIQCVTRIVALLLILAIVPLNFSLRANATTSSTSDLRIKSLKPGSTILIPARNLSGEGDQSSSIFTFSNLPVQGRLTSLFGQRNFGRRSKFHQGIDIGVPIGTPVQSTADGEVTFAGWKSGYGRLIEIDHGDGKKIQRLIKIAS